MKGSRDGNVGAIQTSASADRQRQQRAAGAIRQDHFPIVDLQNTVKQFCCAILCDSVRACAGDSVTLVDRLTKNWDKSGAGGTHRDNAEGVGCTLCRHAENLIKLHKSQPACDLSCLPAHRMSRFVASSTRSPAGIALQDHSHRGAAAASKPFVENLGQSAMRSLDLPYSGLRSPAPGCKIQDRTALIIVPSPSSRLQLVTRTKFGDNPFAILTVTASRARRGYAEKGYCLRFLPFQYFDSTATVRRVFWLEPDHLKAIAFRWIQTY